VKQDDLALKDCDRLVRLAPKSAQYSLARSTLLLKVGRAQDAVDEASRTLKIDPQKLSAYTVRGKAHMALKQFKETADAYTGAIMVNPTAYDLYKERAAIYKMMNKPELARQDAARALH
jgi:tetratricopeptide (TPR) repeat protein